MPKVKAFAYDYLREFPNTTAPQLRAVFPTLSRRTSRRWVQFFKEGVAERDDSTPVEVAVKALSMVEYDPEGEWDLDTFFDTASREVAAKQKRDPIITHDVHPFNVDYPIGVMFVSCMHLGGVYTSYDEFKEVFAQALQIPRLYWAFLGDDIEGFPEWFRDVPAVRNQLFSVDRQIDVLRAILSQINEQNKVLFGSGSQHGGKWLQSRTGENPVKKLYMDELGVPFYDGPAYLKFQVGKQEYKVAVAHEFPGSSMTNPTHAQRRASMTRFPNAEVIVMGDKHNYAHQKITVYGDEYEAGDRASNYAWLLQVGTLKTGPDSFTVEHGFSKGSFGWPIMIFHPDDHNIELAESLPRAQQMLNETLTKL